MAVVVERSGGSGHGGLKLGLFLVGNGMKVDSETERNGWMHDHDNQINICQRREGAAHPDDHDDARRDVFG
jgi:hypothetical protein